MDLTKFANNKLDEIENAFKNKQFDKASDLKNSLIKFLMLNKKNNWSDTFKEVYTQVEKHYRRKHNV